MKFRAWDGEKWRTDFILLHDGSIWDDCDCPVKLKWKVVRSTGLTDKNGVEIWEADIIRSIGFNVQMQDRYPTGPFPVEHPFEYVDVVSMQNLYCPILYIGDSEPNIEVIGNIYENPELLEDTT